MESYGRELGRLTDREYLALASILVAPNALDSARRAAANAERMRRIEALLARRCRPRGLCAVDCEDCAQVRP